MAARLRHEASCFASRLAASGIAVATSRPSRLAGKTLAAVTASVATYSVAEYALGETVPYGGTRRRGPEPLWAAILGGWPEPLGHATAEEVSSIDLPEVITLGPNGLMPVPAGEVRVHWVRAQSPLSQPLDQPYPEPFRRAVEASMEAVAAALWQEAQAQGFGTHVLKHGFHLVVVPGDGVAAAFPCDTVILSVATLNSCLNFARIPDGSPDRTAAMAALQFVLAHELPPLYLRHSDERQLMASVLVGIGKATQYTFGALSALGWGSTVDAITSDSDRRLMGYQAFAALQKGLWWQHEFEADEVACALLARLRLTPEQMAAQTADVALEVLLSLLAQQQRLSTEQKQQRAVKLGFPSADFDAGLALVQAAVESADPDAFPQLVQTLEANVKQRQLLELAKDGGTGRFPIGNTAISTATVAGPYACPEYGINAALADLGSTHPFYSARLARIRHLSGQVPMLLRATTPPVPLGGRYSHASVAEQVADQLKVDLAADAAAKQAGAKAAQAAAEVAGKAVESAVRAGALAAGVAAAATAMAAADQRPS